MYFLVYFLIFSCILSLFRLFVGSWQRRISLQSGGQRVFERIWIPTINRNKTQFGGTPTKRSSKDDIHVQRKSFWSFLFRWRRSAHQLPEFQLEELHFEHRRHFNEAGETTYTGHYSRVSLVWFNRLKFRIRVF